MSAPHDPDALARHAAVLRLYARAWLDPAAAEDAAQEALVRLLQQPAPPRDARAWLLTVVRRICVDLARRRDRRDRLERAAARPDLLDDAGARLDARAAADALAALPARQREAVTLRLWGELSFADAARVMNVGVATAHADYRAGLAALRAALGEPTIQEHDHDRRPPRFVRARAE